MFRRGYASAVIAAVAASLAYTSAFNLQGEYQKEQENILEVPISERFCHSFPRRRQKYSSLLCLGYNVIGFGIALQQLGTIKTIKHNDISKF